MNTVKFNASVHTVFTKVGEVTVHIANIDTRVNRIYFDYLAKDYLESVIKNRPILVIDDEKYTGRFSAIVEYEKSELQTILNILREV